MTQEKYLVDTVILSLFLKIKGLAVDCDHCDQLESLTLYNSM